ncbi:hypothetical protein BLNAU_20110 [Blattamonas nauphoetae]|uniref:Uncharacterized protein n=1 Tax=Blattamonas nauphoetae TaxID=2049346 RepID=A0ABQ9X0R4_9EUKA|nr:hypothetical protein BLNAU_20110 [Blattamonas nauphoetae]
MHLDNGQTHHPPTNQISQSNQEKQEQARGSFVIGQSLFKSKYNRARERESGVEIGRNEEEGREMIESGERKVRFDSIQVLRVDLNLEVQCDQTINDVLSNQLILACCVALFAPTLLQTLPFSKKSAKGRLMGMTKSQQI